MSETSTEQPLLENKKFFRAVTFWKSHFFGGGIAQNKDIYKRAHFSKQVLLHRISFFRRAESSNFLEKKYSAFSIFSGELTF